MEKSQFINDAKFKTRNSAVMVVQQKASADGTLITTCAPEYAMPYTERLHIDFRKMGIILWNYIGGIEVNSKLIRWSQLELIEDKSSTPVVQEPSVQGA